MLHNSHMLRAARAPPSPPLDLRRSGDWTWGSGGSHACRGIAWAAAYSEPEPLLGSAFSRVGRDGACNRQDAQVQCLLAMAGDLCDVPKVAPGSRTPSIWGLLRLGEQKVFLPTSAPGFCLGQATQEGRGVDVWRSFQKQVNRDFPSLFLPSTWLSLDIQLSF